MPFLSPAQSRLAFAISTLAYGNPFLPDRIAAERTILGDSGDHPDPVWAFTGNSEGRADLPRIAAITESLAAELRGTLIANPKLRPTESDAGLYEDVVVYALYYRHLTAIEQLAETSAGGTALFDRLAADLHHFLPPGRLPTLTPLDPAHLLACFVQVRRAFAQIFHSIIGGSPAAARLRAAVWQSIFTHDTRRYRRTLFSRSADFTTLITGESGTGKELVARAVALSRYIAFDPRRKTLVADNNPKRSTLPAADSPSDHFLPLNLSALSPTVIESELFGHRRGAFTGATSDRPGYLESCPPNGAVFLDEIGDLDPALQVKLLRVLQERVFTRLGDTRPRRFLGKLIAATHRDLPALMATGTFRHDLYYRLCSDIILTPPLRDQVTGNLAELERLIRLIAHRLTGENPDGLTAETLDVITRNLGPAYPWPGNFRELEQCVRNVLIRGDYQPLPPMSPQRLPWLRDAEQVALTAEGLLDHYCHHAHSRLGSYLAVATALKLDRRTVAARVTRARSV